jgi:hypothetical protein
VWYRSAINRDIKRDIKRRIDRGPRPDCAFDRPRGAWFSSSRAARGDVLLPSSICHAAACASQAMMLMLSPYSA